MLLIFLSWIYIGFSCANIGFFLDKILKININKPIITILNGLFLITLLASIWAVFGRINVEFHIFLIVLNALIFVKNKDEFIYKLKNCYIRFKKIELFFKIYLITISLLILAQCATAPFIIDNESYYIQTIKWINEYGFVKGLANLHIFLGQTSGWHISQSVFNFSFLYKNFNDLSGFCLFLGNVFAVFKIISFSETNKKSTLIFGLLPFYNIFLFQFINAPSPDLAVYILTFILFSFYIDNFKNCNSDHYKTIFILILFILYIKPLSIGLLFLPLTMLFLNFKKLFKNTTFISISAVSVLLLLIVKNSITTGYPLYPLTIINPKWDFAVPTNIVTYFFSKEMRMSFFITINEFNELSLLQIAYRWIFVSKINAFFNLLTLILFVISPIIILKKINSKPFWIIYITIVFQLTLTIIVSPQYRFFVHYTLFLSLLFISIIAINLKHIKIVFLLCNIVLLLMIINPFNYKTITNNKLLNQNSSFIMSNIVFPHHNSKLETQYKSYKTGNLKYNSPVDNSFFWASGNGNLPCVNKTQIDYFKTKFQFIPQMRSNNLKDGFYDKSIAPNK